MSESNELAALQVEVRHLAEAVDKLSERVDALTAQANRWRGAFGVVLVLGGALSWLAQMVVERVWK